MTFACFGMAVVHSAAWQMAVLGIVFGASVGFTIATLPTLLMRYLPADQTGIGIGTGMYNTLKTLAGAAFAAVMNRLVLDLPGSPIASETAYVIVRASCGALGLLGVLVARRVGLGRTTEAPEPVTAAAS